ncbi:MAG TPA: hypothetical protein VJC18_00365, partial [bacterium]|nr:hypothetical protein [bacterium]
YSVLLDEWQKHRPKWEAARACLCDQLGKCIERERSEAEKYFTEAVALTADGKDIVCCEEVVVIDGIKAIIYPAAAFAQNKILENQDKYRFSSDHVMNPAVLNSWLRYIVINGRLETMGKGQFYSTLSSCVAKATDKDRFVTDIRYCPDPLPEGGREIKLDV